MDVSTLMAGPRGRRFLREFAVTSERRSGGHALSHALFEADRALDPEPDRGVRYVALVADDAASEQRQTTSGDREATPGAEPGVAPGLGGLATGEEGGAATIPRRSSERDLIAAAAAALTSTKLVDATWASVRGPLADAVDFARYWQPPEGSDVLLMREEMRVPLERVARHLAGSGALDWWDRGAAESDQVAMHWDGEPPIEPLGSAHPSLAEHRSTVVEEERRLRRRAPADPAKSGSGEWWSAPIWPIRAPRSAGLAPDGSPLAAHLVEDSLGWETGTGTRLVAPAGARVFEIAAASDWTMLCRQFPLDVSQHKRGDWFHTTGRDGAWVIPDWAEVAMEYDGVHLSIAGYLEAAGRALVVDARACTVLAGWDPDTTYWFTADVRYDGEPRTWIQRASDLDYWWEPAEG